MENIAIARLLDETASLLEIDAADAFRIRSYRRAAEAVEQQTTQLAALVASDPKALLAIPGIGKGMAANICQMVETGDLPAPRRTARQIQAHHAGTPAPSRHGPQNSRAGVVGAGRLPTSTPSKPPRAKANSPSSRAWARNSPPNSSRASKTTAATPAASASTSAREQAERIAALIRAFPGIDEITPAGSLRRGRETVGDLDLLVTGPACEPEVVAAAVEHVATLPLSTSSSPAARTRSASPCATTSRSTSACFRRASYGAALQYFTGSKIHNVALRQRAIKRGLTLNEYALLRLEDNTIVAAASEEDIYRALDLDYIPPELRENCGEIEAAP